MQANVIPMRDGLQVLEPIVELIAIEMMQIRSGRMNFPRLQPPDHMRSQGISVGISPRTVRAVHHESVAIVDISVIPGFGRPFLASSEVSAESASHKRSLVG